MCSECPALAQALAHFPFASLFVWAYTVWSWCQGFESASTQDRPPVVSRAPARMARTAFMLCFKPISHLFLLLFLG